MTNVMTPLCPEEEIDSLQIRRFLDLGRWNDLIPATGMSSLDLDEHASNGADFLGVNGNMDLSSFDDLLDCFSAIEPANVASLTTHCTPSGEVWRASTCTERITENEESHDTPDDRNMNNRNNNSNKVVDVAEKKLKRARFYESEFGLHSSDCVSFFETSYESPDDLDMEKKAHDFVRENEKKSKRARFSEPAIGLSISACVS
mmetsp:Transcript_40172/g.54637  ORF Transcript_40172/g.54637 Transcript_40172/m.54637 type:complete len:203 (-) Transcript_40172:242-850(-)